MFLLLTHITKSVDIKLHNPISTLLPHEFILSECSHYHTILLIANRVVSSHMNLSTAHKELITER